MIFILREGATMETLNLGAGWASDFLYRGKGSPGVIADIVDCWAFGPVRKAAQPCHMFEAVIGPELQIRRPPHTGSSKRGVRKDRFATLQISRQAADPAANSESPPDP